jgi:O-antigen/teichoic acid export membrane protein
MAVPVRFRYVPDEYESEKASNSYLMSLVAVIVGLPLPVVNLIATAMFYAGNRNKPYFVRWHCTQALSAQAITLVMNAAGVYWTLAIVFGSLAVTNPYIAYVITIVLFNLLEFIATIYAAVRTRKGMHVEWWLFGPLTDAFVRP